MGNTTITVCESTREELEKHEHNGHETVGDTVAGLVDIVPTVEDIESGCANCGDEPFGQGPTEHYNGVIRTYHTEYDGEHVTGSTWFCSVECAMETQEETENMVPHDPDEVLVGGRSELQATFEDATFYLDRDTREVGIPVPGAFAGSDSHGGEYDYIGEPVYIRNEGDIVQKGVIEEIIHEETHTGLILGRSIPVEMSNHPDEERRGEYLEVHEEQSRGECVQCGIEFVYATKEPPAECPGCGAEEW